MDEDPGKKAKLKVGVKRVKKKPNLNISKGKLKSTTPKKFNYLNMSVQKQTLRANNRALAQNLSKAKLELRSLSSEHQLLKVSYQELTQEYNRVKKLVGTKDEELEEEAKRRMQGHVKDMKKILDELTQNMLQASMNVSTLNDKCVTLTRRSTASSRGSSFGNMSNLSDRSSLNPRGSAAERNRKQNSHVINYLMNADEFSPPPLGSPNCLYAVKANMSIIAEQSESGNNLDGANQIFPVSENPLETLITAIKPPQRVLKGNTETIQSDGEIVTQDADLDSGMLEIDSNFIELLTASPLSNDNSLEKLDNACSKDKDNDRLNTGFTSEKALSKPVKMDKATTSPEKIDKKKTTKNTEISENGLGLKTSSTLSSLQKPSKLSKLPKSKSTSKLNKDAQKSKPSSDSNVKASESLQADAEMDIPVDYKSFNPFKPTRTLLRSPLKQPMPSVRIEPATNSHKINGAAFLATLERGSERMGGMVSLATETDKSPAASNFGGDNTIYFNSDMDMTEALDIGTLLQNSKEMPKISPLSMSTSETKKDIGMMEKENHKKNEKSKDVASAGTNDHIHGKRNKRKQVPSNEKADKEGENKEAEKEEKSLKQVDIEHKSHEKAAAEVATVEMRNKKPGVFTFSVGRKEADGTRKPVPEKLCRARSKKVKNPTPEKEDRKTGEDRDMFNFGDRTPTVPLEKILQSNKNVYDLSMNESLQAPPKSLMSFRKDSLKNPDIRETNIGDQQTTATTYKVPVKGSPDEQKDSKSKDRSRSKSNTRSRSKSNTRSRSKSRSRRDDDSGDEWVPERKARSRGRTCQKKVFEPEDAENDKTVSDAEREEHVSKSDVYHVPLKESPDRTMITVSRRTRSKSRSRSKAKKLDESESKMSPEKSAKSESESKRCEKLKDTEVRSKDSNEENIEGRVNSSNTYSVPLKDDTIETDENTKSKKGSRSKSSTRSMEQLFGSDSEEEITDCRKARSRRRARSQYKNYIEEDSINFEVNELVKPKSVNKKKKKTVEDDNDFEPEKQTKLNETFEVDDKDKSDHDTESKLGIDSASCASNDSRKSRKSSISGTLKHLTKTPKTLNSQKSLKSAKRTVEKSKAKSRHKNTEDCRDETRRSDVKASRKLLVVDQSEEGDGSLSTKTPAITKSSTSAKSSKSSKLKSQRKREGGTVEDGSTPRKRRELSESSEQKENIPTNLSRLDNLRKQFTDTRERRSLVGNEDSEQNDDNAKRSRRNKNPVSYVPKPLNAKIRQGDSLFEKSGPKAKVDDMRLLLAKKTGLFKEPKSN